METPEAGMASAIQKLEEDGEGDVIRQAEAVVAVSRILLPLAREARLNVLAWAVNAFGKGEFIRVEEFERGVAERAAPVPASTSQSAILDGRFRSFRDLWLAVGPESRTEQALVSVYWHTVICQRPEVESAQVSADLTEMGERTTNVHRTMIDLVTRKPALLVVTGKSGQGFGTRKRFRTTAPGDRYIEDRIKARQQLEGGLH
jgi:hypothetical protein